MRALVSRMTKWSPDCDVPLHRLICYINSSMGIKLKGFVSDKISYCKLLIFCDTYWAGDVDSNLSLVHDRIGWPSHVFPHECLL